jgi:hypothetical protein
MNFFNFEIKNIIIKGATIFRKFLVILFHKWFSIKCGFYDFDHIFEIFVI